MFKSWASCCSCRSERLPALRFCNAMALAPLATCWPRRPPSSASLAQESVLAVVLGAALFQGPLFKWLHRQRRRGGEVAAGSVVLAEVVRAEAVVSRCEVNGE